MSACLRVAVGVLIAALLLPLVGCDRGPARYGITGNVTYKGAKIADGWVTFVPADPNVGTQEAARITDGKFVLPAANGLLSGEYRVAITATEGTPKPAPDELPGAPRRGKALIPDEYNRESKLRIEIQADGKREFDFRLE